MNDWWTNPWVRRRCGLALGVALLVGGWGMTSYADEKQQAIRTGSHKFSAWTGQISKGTGYAKFGGPSREIFQIGFFVMSLGAGLTAFSLPKPKE